MSEQTKDEVRTNARTSRPVVQRLSFHDAHILRSYLSQTNHTESWQRRMIRDLDAAIEEATRNRRPRAAA